MNNLGQGIAGGVEQTPYNVIQHNLDNISLTSSEIGQLWTTYLAESMSKYMLPYFVEKCKDPDIRSVLQFALEVSIQHVNSITEIFNAANFPVLHGFTDEDFNITAEQLFSDTFMLAYTRAMAKYGMTDFSSSFSNSARPDICGFFEGCLNNSKEIYKQTNVVLLAKGLLERTPYIPIPDMVEYVDDAPNFFKGFIGDKRPLNALEIGHVFGNSYLKSLDNALLQGFAQAAKSKKVKDYLSRGKQIADKQIEVFNSLLRDEDLPVPSSYQNQVTASTESPFSDKMMMFHVTVISSACCICGFGLSLSKCARKDVALTFSRLIAELIDFAKDGLDLMIEHGWLERVPETANRKELRTQL